MRETWRWFGPKDTVSLYEIAQAGASGIVTALHHVPTGEVWTVTEINQRKDEISKFDDGSPSLLNWSVVESLPVSEDIKRQSGNWREHIKNYTHSMANLSAAGISDICYNFMPILDWTRTDLAWRLPNGAKCMRFDLADFAAFDLHILKRQKPKNDYPISLRQLAAQRYEDMSEDRRSKLTSNIVFGLPGASENFSLSDVKSHLDAYAKISARQLKQHAILRSRSRSSRR